MLVRKTEKMFANNLPCLTKHYDTTENRYCWMFFDLSFVFCEYEQKCTINEQNEHKSKWNEEKDEHFRKKMTSETVPNSFWAYSPACLLEYFPVCTRLNESKNSMHSNWLYQHLFLNFRTSKSNDYLTVWRYMSSGTLMISVMNCKKNSLLEWVVAIFPLCNVMQFLLHRNLKIIEKNKVFDYSKLHVFIEWSKFLKSNKDWLWKQITWLIDSTFFAPSSQLNFLNLSLSTAPITKQRVEYTEVMYIACMSVHVLSMKV